MSELAPLRRTRAVKIGFTALAVAVGAEAVMFVVAVKGWARSAPVFLFLIGLAALGGSLVCIIAGFLSAGLHRKQLIASGILLALIGVFLPFIAFGS